MSTVKVAAIQHPSAATAAITLDADGGALIGGQAAYARNLLYNGAMQVAQRGTSTASITTNGYYTADRFGTQISALGTWTQSVENDAPTGSGLRKSIKMLCTTADSTPAANDYILMSQALEGQDLQRIAKGTASALQLTLSFWVKSNVTGTYIIALRDNDNSRSVSAAYTVSASATWEKKIITFPADTTGAFDNDNGGSFTLQMILAVGSSYSSGTLQTSWASHVDANVAVGQTNLAASTNNYWQVTGVQLEVGPAATPFEFKSFGQELQECQRYFQKNFLTEVAPANAIIAYRYAGFSWSSTAAHSQRITFATTMRSVPVITFYSPANGVVAPANGKWQIFDGTSTWQNATTGYVTEAADGFVVDMTALTVTTRSAYIAYGGWAATAEL